MIGHRKVSALFALLATAAVAITVMVSAPRAVREPALAAPVELSAPEAPAGYRPVAPGSYTFIPEGLAVAGGPQAEPVSQPAAPNGYRPVAPGSYTFIPDTD